MEFNQITQEDDTETLIPTDYGAGVAAVKVVEYMLSSMSNELLCKFPDNSAFDFDYTQSSIWSPLLPHPSNLSSPVVIGLQRKLLYDDNDVEEEQGKEKNREHLGSCMFDCFKIGQKFGMRRKMKRGRISSNSSGNVSVCGSLVQMKGWKKVLKAASKRFKKTMKKKDSGSHLKLYSNGFSRISY